MKQKILAICLFVIIIGFVITNTLVLQRVTDRLISKVEELNVDRDEALEKVIEIDEFFREKECYIGFTVSHDDLTNIEDCFAELTGYISVGDTDGAKVAKCRLIRFFEHLRRLVGFNIDTII